MYCPTQADRVNEDEARNQQTPPVTEALSASEKGGGSTFLNTVRGARSYSRSTVKLLSLVRNGREVITRLRQPGRTVGGGGGP